MQQNDMENLVSRTERLIGALTGAIMSTTEAAAERIELAAQVAMAQQRLQAFSSVLESVDAQRQVLVARERQSGGALKALFGHQLAALAAQELAILERAGLAPEAAQLAHQEADAPPATHTRKGRRFVPVNGNGHE